MKKLYLFFIFFTAITISQAQFVDNFESYTVGAYLGVSSPKWTTWSGTPGGADDVKITNTDAHSGTKSVYFQSTVAGGGPEDVVLLFDSLYTKGELEFDFWMKVDAGKGAYLNLQGDPTIGTTWALNVYFVQTGAITVQDDNSVTKATATYPPATWFKFSLHVDFFNNEWKLLVDDVLKGTWTNPINQAASVDFFPLNSTNVGGNGLSGFYIDDVSVKYTPYVIPPRNGALTAINYAPKLVDQVSRPGFTIENIGTDTLKSFDVVVKYGSNTFTESFTSNILHQNSGTFTFNTAVTAALDTFKAYITNVNGQGTDMDPSNDTMHKIISQLATPAPDKLVIAEMVTGTNHGWAPKGIVALETMMDQFDGFILPINIHQGDPMEDTSYVNGISPLVSQYPSVLVNRGQVASLDPSFMEDEFVDFITQPATAVLSNTSRFINDRSTLEVDVVVEYKSAATGDWGVLLVVTEDGVTGTDTSYNQKNNYSSAAFNIPLKNDNMDWQQESDPVPASKMTYNHVARYIAPSFNGATGVFPTSISAGDTFHHTFRIAIDSTLNLSNFNIISMVLNPDGEIDNAAVSDLSGAQVVIDSTGVGVAPVHLTGSTRIYPNPTSGIATLEFDFIIPTAAEVMVMDITGKSIIKKENQIYSGRQQLKLDLTRFADGIYFIQVKSDNKIYTEKLVLKK